MTAEKTIESFLKELFSKSPVPGGGGASALGGAVGAALGGMVSSLTVGKKTYADVEEEIRELMGRLERLMGQLVALSDRDEEVFAPLAAAYALPSGTDEEKAEKTRVMEGRLLDASLVPLEIMEKSLEGLEIVKILAEKGSRMAVSDAGVAAQFLRASLGGAVMNVYINTKSMKDRAKAEELTARAKELTEKGFALADEVYGTVLQKLI